MQSSRSFEGARHGLEARVTLGVFVAFFVWALCPRVGVAGESLKGVVLTGQLDAKGVLVLRGSDARRQVLVSGTFGGGAERDLTREARFEVSPAGVAKVDSNGVVTPLADGVATVVATVEGRSASPVAVRVERFGQDVPINFANQVIPVFTKLGCNSGGCHGKLAGQNGFRLSLLGFEPGEDYEHLVKESRGRRVFPAAPERSLLLQKAVGEVPHGGGKRMEPGSDDYRLLVRWIGQGMPYGAASDPTVERIEVQPARRILSANARQQLAVTAVYTDGSTEDVTGQALYEANDREVADVDAGGRVGMFAQPGDVAVMVRYQGKVGVFRGTEPLGAPVGALPPVRNFIDAVAFKKLREMGVPPSGISSDETFVRRVTIDIAGRIPTAEETRAFVADADPAKRDKLIDRLLESPGYADNFANKWGALLRNRRSRPAYARGTFEFHDWVRDSIAANKPYDRFVREILTASGDVDHNPPVAWYRQVQDANAQLQDTAQLFLGVRLLCAQCHHHPFERWGQQDYYQFSAFFSRVGRQRTGTRGEEVVYFKPGQAGAVNPRTKRSVSPAALGQKPLELSAGQDPRVALADWMTARENPWFARSLVNRYWKHFLGRGVVEPEDDMRETNPPTNPELLDALAREFTESGFDLKALVRTICRSTVYQLDSTPNAFNKIDRQNFSRYYPKRLAAETLLDAVNVVTETRSKFAGLPAGTSAVSLPDNSFNEASYFLTVFGRPDSSSACECERSQQPSLAQSLHLINAKEMQEKLGAADGMAAKLVADAARSDAEKVAELYVRALSRQPDAVELSAALAYLDRVGSRGGEKDRPTLRRAAYEDLVWTLVNTKEFSFNH